MRNVNVSIPEMAFVAATRGMAGEVIVVLPSGYLGELRGMKLGLVRDLAVGGG